MRRAAPPRLARRAAKQTLTERPSTLYIRWLQLLCHTVPVSLVQTAYFTADILVLLQLSRVAESLWAIGVAVLALSLVLALISIAATASNNPTSYTARLSREVSDDGTMRLAGRQHRLSITQVLLAMVLAVVNMHVLFFGYLYAAATFENNPRRANELYGDFVGFKLLETGSESIVLSILTVAALVGNGDTAGGDATTAQLYVSSITLSILSMSYGFFGWCTHLRTQQVKHSIARCRARL